MRLKNRIYPLLALLLCGAVNAQKVTKLSLTKKDDNVIVSFDAMVDKLDANYKLTMTPTLWNGAKEQPLQAIVVMGRKQAILQSRKGNLQSGSILSKPNQLTSYSVTIPFEKWMSGASLRIDKVLKGCCEQEILSPLVLTSNGVSKFLNPILPPIVPLFAADSKAVSIGELEGKIKAYPFVYHIGVQNEFRNKGLVIAFEQSSKVIDIRYKDNAHMLEQIVASIKMIKAESDIELTKIKIEGGASIEGSFSFNEKIGKDRAGALISILVQYCDANLFEVDNIGENWDELYRLVEQSDMKYKNEVLAIIKNYTIDEGRELKLMKLRGGAPYNYIYKEFFPALRKASYVRVYYDFKSNNTFAKIDSASEFIKSKRYNEALAMLKDVMPTPYTYNLMGVCYMMTGDAVNARVCLGKAIDGGDANAKDNLKSLDYQRDNIQYK